MKYEGPEKNFGKEIVVVYTDGACFPNPGRGGWAYTTLDGRESSGFKEKTTNQEMELVAAVEAVKALASPAVLLKVVSDSLYVVDGITKWVPNWEKRNWQTKNGTPVKYQKLWFELRLRTVSEPVEFYWERGHNGNPGNEEADRLATLASGADPKLVNALKSRWHTEKRIAPAKNS